MEEKTWQFADGAEYPWQYKYEHAAVTNDCVIFTYVKPDLKVLLVERGGEPYKGRLALPGGFLRNDETAEEGAMRELKEETNLKLLKLDRKLSSGLTQFGVFSDPERDPRERVITIGWYGFVRPVDVQGGSDAAHAGWYPLSEEILSGLAFDHRRIIEAALDRIRTDIGIRPVGFELLDKEFSFPDLQRLYETILGGELDRGNFQRHWLSRGFIEKTDSFDVNRNTSSSKKIGRPSPLYRFNKDKYEEEYEEGMTKGIKKPPTLK